MSQALAEIPYDLRDIIENIVTEDDEQVDNLFSEKEQRLLAHNLYCSWTPPPSEEAPEEKRKFLADSNIGIYRTPYDKPVAPDMFLTLDVETPFDWHARERRSYFIWEFEKPPDVVIEIVSNTEGHELDEKLRHYARLDVSYYVVYDPQHLLMEDMLRVHERGFGRRYRRRDDYNLPDVGLNLTFWEGSYEDGQGSWLRWCDSQGKMIPTGAERAERLAAKLRELGVDPDKL